MVYCPNCGSQISEKDKFCPDCGAQLKAVEVVEEATVVKKRSIGSIIFGVILTLIGLALFGIVLYSLWYFSGAFM
jgi:uncharacterized membrane protein YvbJ